MSSIVLKMIITILVCVSTGSPSFVDSYIKYSKRHYRTYHKLVERTSKYRIKQSDTLLFIETLTLKKEIENEWDYNNTIINGKFASWEYFDVRKKLKAEEFLLLRGDHYDKRFVNGGLYFKSIWGEYNGVVDKQLLEAASLRRPSGIFTVAGIEGWFFIVGETIEFYEWEYSRLNYHEDALGYLKNAFIQPHYMPVFTGDLKWWF